MVSLANVVHVTEFVYHGKCVLLPFMPKLTISTYIHYLLISILVLLVILLTEFTILNIRLTRNNQTHLSNFTDQPASSMPYPSPTTGPLVPQEDPGTIVIISPDQIETNYLIGTVKKIQTTNIVNPAILSTTDKTIFFADLYIAAQGPYLQAVFVPNHICTQPINQKLIYEPNQLITDHDIALKIINKKVRIEYLTRDNQIIKHPQGYSVGFKIGLCQ